MARSDKNGEAHKRNNISLWGCYVVALFYLRCDSVTNCSTQIRWISGADAHWSFSMGRPRRAPGGAEGAVRKELRTGYPLMQVKAIQCVYDGESPTIVGDWLKSGESFLDYINEQDLISLIQFTNMLILGYYNHI